MLILSFGFQKPQSNDRGPVIFPAMEENIQQLNDHTHDGVNSAKLTGASIESVQGTINSAGWVLLSGGHYKQTVNMPVGFDYDKTQMSFRIASTGHEINPTIEKVSSTQYDIYCDDNTLTLTALYN